MKRGGEGDVHHRTRAASRPGDGAQPASVRHVVGSSLRTVQAALAAGERVTLPGFGTFYTSQRRAGRIRSVRTGRQVDVPARRVAAFRVGEVLKRAWSHGGSAGGACSGWPASVTAPEARGAGIGRGRPGPAPGAAGYGRGGGVPWGIPVASASSASNCSARIGRPSTSVGLTAMTPCCQSKAGLRTVGVTRG